jgi:hypothetical protein
LLQILQTDHTTHSAQMLMIFKAKLRSSRLAECLLFIPSLYITIFLVQLMIKLIKLNEFIKSARLRQDTLQGVKDLKFIQKSQHTINTNVLHLHIFIWAFILITHGGVLSIICCLLYSFISCHCRPVPKHCSKTSMTS